MSFLKHFKPLRLFTPLRRKTPLRRTVKKPPRREITSNADFIGISDHDLEEEYLWPVFSVYIRKRDRISGDMARGVTCPKIRHWKEVDCGHFISRTYRIIKFHELNNHAQCPECNRDFDGNQHVYEAVMIRMYGAGMVEELNRLKDSVPYYRIPRAKLIELYHTCGTLSHDP
jgi:Bacteriophage Lambda NinG protein